MVRQDITSSFGTSATKADGVPLTVTLTLLDNANGQVTFKTIYPGAYNGRWPHIHFEVFESMNNASAGYETSARNFPNTTLGSDNVFGEDGGIYQLATVSGSVTGGYAAGLNVTI